MREHVNSVQNFREVALVQGVGTGLTKTLRGPAYHISHCPGILQVPSILLPWAASSPVLNLPSLICPY